MLNSENFSRKLSMTFKVSRNKASRENRFLAFAATSNATLGNQSPFRRNKLRRISAKWINFFAVLSNLN